MTLQAIPFTQVQIRDAFWAPRREANRRISLPLSLDKLAEAGNLRNLELAAAGATEGFVGPVFADSDVYKALEAVAYSLATDPDPELERRVDEIIAQIAAAQRPDGYLNTAYQVKIGLKRRWTNLRDNHELYCAGHLFEAAVAHFQATGKRTLLEVATKFADHIDSVFGDAPGERMGYPGHPEIELALVKLWRVTGERRYFDLARFFVVNRGRKFFADEHGTPHEEYRGEYWQDHLPIREHAAIVGHAVRAGYLYSAVVDVAAETGDAELLQMAERVWDNTTNRRMYVTGGIGSSAHNEGFTGDYDLPNLTAYQETCASVAMMMWNQRLNLITGDSKYADILELALYNGFLAGVSLDGRRYFYVNPLASEGGHHRQEWFGCACCPPNVTRTLASLGGYAYAASDRGLWVNLYIRGGARAQVGGQNVALDVMTEYPWDGKVQITVTPDAEAAFALHLRVPGWCEGASVRVNGLLVSDAPLEKGYFVLDRAWKPGDAVEMDLPMPVRRIGADPRVAEDRGCLALARGPLVYCVEDCDLDAPVAALALPAAAEFTAGPELLGGIVTLVGNGETGAEPEWRGGLYRTAAPLVPVAVTAVPYYAWDNRAPGGMRVWIPTIPPPPATRERGE
ncbi:MAG: glycoside hydrolase family 127 protein [Armatimonadetes bacterium]|nr:glycoside hydrolase family 127 protein [Armatimonadota bacterium]